MSLIKSRLGRIEEAARGGPCPECALPADGPGHIVYSEDGERPKDANERCPRCGRFLWLLIRVVYEPEEEGADHDLRYP